MYTPSPNFTGNDLELRAKQEEEAARRQVLDTEQIKAQLANTHDQLDMLLKMLSKINRDEVLSTSCTKDFIMFKLGDLTDGEVRFHPDNTHVEVESLD